MQLAKIEQALKDCVLPNHANSYSQRAHANIKRRKAARTKSAARYDASNELEELALQIEREKAERKAAYADNFAFRRIEPWTH